jgi:23S rRNA (pseudouridine1915-N3)-methyltransferase
VKLLVLAIGQRQPHWADEAWADFARRFAPEMPLVLRALKAESRQGGRTAGQCLAAEADRFEAALRSHAGARCVVLDEAGARLTTRALAARLAAWRGEGRDVVILIGGPDGLHGRIKERAEETLRLSDLTLPHTLARVLLAEALYRAATVLQGHPYHRE